MRKKVYSQFDLYLTFETQKHIMNLWVSKVR